MSARGRGERAGLTRAQIMTTALALTDRDGLTALSMRRLAAALGVEAMTLYHYVPTKDALLDGLVETVFVESTPLAADGLPWLTVMTRYADTLRSTLLRHPGVVSLVIARPAATPATLARVEEALALLTRDGFPLARAVDLVNCLSLFVAAHAHSEIATGELLGTGDVPSDGSSNALARLDPATFPLVVQAARTGSGVDDATRFRVGVRAILRGFELGLTDDAWDRSGESSSA